jgi:DNA-directed RNA polymerase specialized sigma subunit
MAEIPKTIERDDVDVALEAWARWAKCGLAGLGWSATSLLAKMIEYGVRGAAQSGGSPLVESDGLYDVVEDSIKRLPLKERKVVIVFYTKWYPREVAASRCGVTEDNFRRLLSNARRSIKDYLSGRMVRHFDFPVV